MPHRICFIVCFCLINFNGFCQNTFVPDDNFEQALIDLGYDSAPLNDYIPTANIIALTQLDIAGKNILDLTGIEDFIALTNLDCSDNMLTSLDVSKNINLTELYCGNNRLATLDVSNNTSLMRLWCFSNQLISLDISNNTNLISLRCEDNLLSNLNVSNLTKLNVLTFERNYITTIDVSNNTGLGHLECGQNLLTYLNIEANTNLSYLSCEENQLTELNVDNNSRLAVLNCSNNQISKLNVSNNPNLTDLDAGYNQICQLNLKNENNSNMLSVNFSENKDLNCVIVDNPNANHTGWVPAMFNNYVSSMEDCSGFIPVDHLEDVAGKNYILPPLINGNYFTGSNGSGTALNAGDIISKSQIIYIYDETTCYSNETSFYVLITEDDYYVPKFFTPNGDGNHDIWKVTDNVNMIDNITIYNRHGKLLKYLPSNSNGWDGTFNGQLLPTDSYWYVIVLNTKEVIKGYIALKR